MKHADIVGNLSHVTYYIKAKYRSDDPYWRVYHDENLMRKSILLMIALNKFKFIAKTFLLFLKLLVKQNQNLHDVVPQ